MVELAAAYKLLLGGGPASARPLKWLKGAAFSP